MIKDANVMRRSVSWRLGRILLQYVVRKLGASMAFTCMVANGYAVIVDSSGVVYTRNSTMGKYSSQFNSEGRMLIDQ